jgi:hypothetical protein
MSTLDLDLVVGIAFLGVALWLCFNLFVKVAPGAAPPSRELVRAAVLFWVSAWIFVAFSRSEQPPLLALLYSTAGGFIDDCAIGVFAFSYALALCPVMRRLYRRAQGKA